MDEKMINAVEMTRRIRDAHAKRLAGKSHAQRIAYYRERAKKMQKKAAALLPVIEGGYSTKAGDAVAVREKRGEYKTKKR